MPTSTRLMLTALLAAITLSAAPISFSVFTTPPAGVSSNGTIGIAYAGNKFIGSVWHSGQALYSTDLSGGSQQVFAPGVSIPGGNNQEHAVAASIGQGGFANGDVYVGFNGGITHITNDGTASNTFVTGLNGNVFKIVFDSGGSFGNDMVVATGSGAIYRVNSAGVATLVANVGEETEGLDIAPMTFAANPGYIYTASDSGTIRAISPTGVVTVVANVANSETVNFIPTSFAGNAVEGFYGANFTPNIVKADPSQFAGFLGDILVTGEFDHQVTALHWNGTSFVSTNLGSYPNQPEDGIFVALPTPMVPEPGTMWLIAGGLGLAAISRKVRRQQKQSSL